MIDIKRYLCYYTDTMKENLDFEINFYENLVREKPNFVDALKPLADAYTKRGMFRKGLEVDKKLVKLRPKDESCWYNLACSYSLLKDIDKAFYALEKAIQLGYNNFEFIKQDTDLDNIRKDSRYKIFINKVR